MVNGEDIWRVLNEIRECHVRMETDIKWIKTKIDELENDVKTMQSWHESGHVERYKQISDKYNIVIGSLIGGLVSFIIFVLSFLR